ncbi:PepSY domain-containing protein [Castellaniella sp.]|uniref:PepSY domain-containing protein n=1 Tax=Castellaniella sp. TaxID=1955812 RepID=UPI003561723C
MNRRNLLMATLAAPLGLYAASSQADDDDRERAEQLQALGEVLPLQEVLASVQKTYPGQVLKVEFEEDDDCKHARRKGRDCEIRWIYEFKILQPEGRLVKLDVDARTGEVIKVSRKDARTNRKKRS